jgi:hypothetical protein
MVGRAFLPAADILVRIFFTSMFIVRCWMFDVQFKKLAAGNWHCDELPTANSCLKIIQINE